MFTHPSDSYLIFDGRQAKDDNTAYANADEVALTNNAIMHLFSRIEYHLSNKLIESLSEPRQATSMFGQLKYPDDLSKAQCLNRLWYKDTAKTAAKANNNVLLHWLPRLTQTPQILVMLYSSSFYSMMPSFQKNC